MKDTNHPNGYHDETKRNNTRNIPPARTQAYRRWPNVPELLHGNDVCAEIRGNDLFECDEYASVFWQKIKLETFLELVNQTVER
jgi:hypothetical protein